MRRLFSRGLIPPTTCEPQADAADPREVQTLPERCTKPREVYICKRLRKIEITRPRKVYKVKKSIQGAEEEKI